MLVWENVIGAGLGLTHTSAVADHNALTQQQSDDISVDIFLILTAVSLIKLLEHLLQEPPQESFGFLRDLSDAVVFPGDENSLA